MDEKKEPINLVPAKPKVSLSKILAKGITSTFQNSKLRNKLFEQLGNGYNHAKYWSFKYQPFHQIHLGAALSIF